VPGKAACGIMLAWPGKVNCGLNGARFVPPRELPWYPDGNCDPTVPVTEEVAVLPLAAEVLANLERICRSDICSLWATGGILANVAGSLLTSDFISDRSSSSWFKTLCKTAFAGLFPAKLSLAKCWCDSARHSTSAKREFSHGLMGRVLAEIQVCSPTQLFFNYQCLLQ